MQALGSNCLIARGPAARIPRLPAMYLSRERLVHALSAAQPRLRLLCAPAGFGKTALLCEFLQHVPHSQTIVWLSLGGNRATVSGLQAALALELGLAPDSTPQRLLTVLQSRAQTLWLVLDDLPDERCSGLSQWVEHLLTLPAGKVQLLVSCRRRPDWNLARLTLAGDLLELGNNELAFQRDEFTALARRLSPLADARTLHALWQETGSWCAGIRLLLGNPNAYGSLPSPLLREYLKHEVLARLNEEQCQMLYGLAHLPRVSQALCEALWDGQGGARTWRHLLQAQVFLMPVPGHAHQYQLLPAVAAALRERLGGQALTRLRLRYCRLMSEQGDFDVAIDQALLADQPEAAVGYLQRLRLSWLINDRNLIRFIAWREQLSARLLDSSPRLIFLCARALMIRGRLDEAAACLQQVARFLPQAAPAYNRRLLANWQALHGAIQALRGNGELARLHCRAALSELTAEDWLSTLLCLSTLARVHIIAGQLQQARQLLHQGVQLARRQGSQDGEIMINTDRFRLMSLQGELTLAQALLLEDIKPLQLQGSVGNPLLGRLLFLHAELLVVQDRLDDAEQVLQAGMQQTEDSCVPFVLHGYFLQIEIAVRRDRLEHAQVLLHAAERRMHCGNVDSACYHSALDLLKMRILAHQGHWQQVLSMGHGLEEHLQGVRPKLPPLHLPTLAQRNQLLLAQAEIETGDTTLGVQRLQQLQAQCQRLGFERLGDEAQRVLLRYQTCAVPDSTTRVCSVPSHQDDLTPREIGVLKLLAEGLSIREVGDRLFISVNTVKTHAKSINVKLGAVRRTQAINSAKAMGILV